MTAEALFTREWREIRKVVGEAAAAGDVYQLADGRAGVMTGLNAAAVNDQRNFETAGQFTFTKPTTFALLDGGRVYWDGLNNALSYYRVNNQTFYLGRAVGDQAATATTAVVNINIEGREDIDLARDPFASVAVKTAGAPSLTRLGGAHLLAIDNTNEAQKIDALTQDGLVTAGDGIVTARLRVAADDSSTHAIFSLGVASGTHATAFTSITDYLGIQVKAGDGKIYALSSDGTTTVAATDTTKTYAVGTPFEVWFDLRNPASVGIYVNGVQVLTGTTFSLAQVGATALYLLAHLVKTLTTDTMSVQVDSLRFRGSEI